MLLTAVPESVHVVPQVFEPVEYVVYNRRGVPSLKAVQLGVNDPAAVANPLGGLYQINDVGPDASAQPISVLAIKPKIVRKTFDGLMLVMRLTQANSRVTPPIIKMSRPASGGHTSEPNGGQKGD